MGGDATFSGTNYQASVIAYVFVHVLTESKLRWLSVADDTPLAASGEVRGPGDDARIEFRSGVSPVEVQAKHGLKPKKCVEAFRAIRDGSAAGETTTVLLVVDSTSSASIRHDLKRDLDRLRSGRTDELKDVAEGAVKYLGDQALAAMGRVHVRTLDVDNHTEAGVAKALELLSENLEEPSHATAAWAVLEKEAATICASRSRRDRKALIALLSAAGFSLRPPKQTRKWHDDLRHSRKLLSDDEPELALAFVKEVEADFRKSGAKDPEVLYRLNQHRAAALLQVRLGDNCGMHG